MYVQMYHSLLQVMEDFSHSERFHPLYFWFYFVFLNSLWIIIPTILIWQAVNAMVAAQTSFDNSVIKVKAKKRS